MFRIRDNNSVIGLLERKAELSEIRALLRHGGAMVVEGGAGLGKTALLDAACTLANQQRRLVFRARGSDLEGDFALGVVRQLFERYCADASEDERGVLFAGHAHAARAVLVPGASSRVEQGATFALLHGLYWLTINIAAAHHRILIAIDDAHWADDPSLRWLAYLVPRLQGRDISLIVALRPDERRSQMRELANFRGTANSVRLALLSEQAVAAIARRTLAKSIDDGVCTAIHRATGGNPFYVFELLRALGQPDRPLGAGAVDDAIDSGGLEAIARRLAARLRGLNPSSLRLAQAIAILGDDCQLRHAAAISRMEIGEASHLAAELIRLDVLGHDRPPRFLHPIVRHAAVQTLSSAEQADGHRAAARILHAEHASSGRVAAHLMRLPASGDPWTVERLREAARAALESGAPTAAAEVLEHAMAEPPPPGERVEVLREAAWAQQQAGRATACRLLEEALAVSEGPALRAEIASQLAKAHAALFHWREAVNVLEHALVTLRDVPAATKAALQCQLVVAGLRDAAVARRAMQVMQQLSRGRLTGASAQAMRVAQGKIAIMTGRPVHEAASLLETALASLGSESDEWDMQAELWWCLIAAERFGTADAALRSAIERVDRSGSSRGLVAVYTNWGLLKFRLGALPEADTSARIALRVVQDGDFTPGLPFVATVLADVAVASGEMDEAQAFLDLLPRGKLPAGVGTVLIPAARGRLRLAQGRPEEALAEFEACMALWRADTWGLDMRDAGYVHARSGAAQALLALGDARRARELAEAELADVRRFGGRRALGAALRVVGLARGGDAGLEALAESVRVLADSPTALEYAASLVEWGGALRRAGQPTEARRILAQGLDAAARCAARPLAARAREELRIAGGRPRRDWSVGVESLTPSELRIANLARDGRSNRQIAQELYLAIKTVEGHLARAYGKLGITGRPDLSRVLGGEKSRVATR